jgi:hypothetical protein
VSVRRENGHKVVVQDVQSEGTREVPCDEILVASGIRSNADLLHVELAGIATDKRGWIVTDEYLQTSQPHIWRWVTSTGSTNSGTRRIMKQKCLWPTCLGSRTETRGRLFNGSLGHFYTSPDWPCRDDGKASPCEA